MSSLIKISKEYPGLWLGQETTVAPNEDKKEAWRKAEQEMDSYYHSRNKPPMTDFNTGQPAASDLLNPHEGLRLQKLIVECKTPEELDKLYNDAEKYGLTPTWDKKLKQLKE